MADVITRFKLETTQYDSKLRDAAKGLVDYTRVAKQAGDEMGKFTKEQADAARALGNITTSATNSKDKVKELVSAFNDVANAYNALTDKQKESDFGKAMAESLNTLKGRIRDAKQEMNSTGGIMEQLAQKFTINFDAVKLLNIGLKTTETALKVAKDAFFASEANVDEWGRTMQAAEGIYEGFLNALNAGDISGYLSRIDEIVNAARAAYNELDRLGTMKTIQGPQMSAQQTENERMRMMIQTGRYIAPLDGRRATMQNGQLLTPEQIRRIEQQLQNGMQKVVGLVGNEVKQTGRAIDKYYDSLAKQNGMTLQEFKKGTSSMAEYDKRMEGYRKYQEWNDKAAADYYRQGGRNGFMNFDNGNPYLEFKKWGVFRVDKEGKNSLNDLVNLIKQRDQQTSQAYSTLSQSYRAINRAEGITVKKILGGGGVGGKGGAGGGGNKTPKTEEQLNNEQIQKLTQEYIKATDDRRKAIEAEIKGLQQRNDEIKKLTDIAQGKVAPEGSLNALNEKLKELQTERGELSDPIEIEIQDHQIKKVQDEIDRLNGKKVDVELEVNNLSSFEQLQQSLRIKIAEQNMEVDTNTLQTLMQTAIKNGIDSLDPDFASLQEKMRDGMNIPDDTWQALQDQINKKLKGLGIEPIKIDFKTGNGGGNKSDVDGFKNFNDKFSQLNSGVGSIVSGIQQMGVEIPKELQSTLSVLQGISTIMTGILAIITVLDAKQTAQTALSFIPFYAHGGLIHAATGYMVPGNDHADRTLIAASSGELILNRAQQGVIAGELEGGAGRSIHVTGMLRGEDIVLVADRYGRRTGKGELAFWK